MSDDSRLETSSFVIAGGRISRNRVAKTKTKQSNKRLRASPEKESKRRKTKATKILSTLSTPIKTEPFTKAEPIMQQFPMHLLSPMCSPNLDAFSHWGLRGGNDRMLPQMDFNGSPQTRSFTKQFKAMAKQLEMDHQTHQTHLPVPGLDTDIDILAKARSAWSLSNAPKAKRKESLRVSKPRG
jgi:hypothetical protein